MKPLKRFTIATLAISIVGPMVQAYDFQLGGLYYNILDKSFAETNGLPQVIIIPEDEDGEYKMYYPLCIEVTYNPQNYSKRQGSYSGDVAIPEKLTYDNQEYYVARIGDEAFRFSSSLNTVTLPLSSDPYAYEDTPSCYMAFIGERAFADSHITSLVGDTKCLRAISDYAFASSYIKDITLYSGYDSSYGSQDNSTIYGKYIFANSAITKASLFDRHINNKYEQFSISEGMFSGCTNLREVSGTVDTIGVKAFENCSRLTSAPQAVYICDEAFSECTSLYSYYANFTDYIGSKAFKGCTSLGNIEFYGGSKHTPLVFSPELDSFEGCTSLKEIEIERPMVSDRESLAFCNPFGGCPITKITFDWYGLNLPFTPSSFPNLEEIVSNTLIPPHIGTLSASQYAKVKVTVPQEVLSVYSQSLYWKNFSKISTLDEAINIGVIEADGVYYFCSTGDWGGTASVTQNPFGFYEGEIEIPAEISGINGINSKVYRIEESAFYGCKNFKKVTLTENIMSIERNAFAESGIQSIDLSMIKGAYNDGGLGRALFADCKNLTEVKLPETINTLPEQMFRGCTSLAKISLPTGIQSIGTYAFADCSSLATLSFADLPALSTIGEGAFKYSGLTKLDITARDIQIGDDAFEGCKLPRLDLPRGCHIGKGSFRNNPVSSIVLQPYTTIEERLFEGNSPKLNLIDVTFYFNYYGVGNWVADKTTVNKLVIRPNWNIDGKLAWNWPTWDIKEIDIHGSPVPNTDEFTEEQYKTIVLNVEKEAYERFRDHAVWGKFLNLRAVDFADISTVDTDQVRIYVSDGNLVIDTTPKDTITTDAPVAIYSIDGRCIATRTLTGSTTQIPLPSGVYLVNVANRTHKIIVR